MIFGKESGVGSLQLSVPPLSSFCVFAKAAAKCWVPSQPSKRRHRNNSRSKPFRRLSFSSQYCHMASSTDRRCSFRKRHTDSRSLLVSRLSACCLTVANGSCRSMLSSMNRCSTSAALLTFLAAFCQSLNTASCA